ncbi:NAD(P)-binding protein [Coprinellus micaceus]|uniref:NAD(P)-binding protein n=1 Tax=Coprinellus micaceus TaxID=71717 RepID=A0A4Y7THS6_COPMI|nr:NAD(P)-binding protein [Coprinellus micaceus]
MTTLITGGTSKIGLGLAKRLRASGKGVIFGTRSPQKIPSQYKHVLHDWDDPATFGNAFTADLGATIESVYLLPPPACLEPLPIVKSFIDIAVEKGVKKLVLLSGSPCEKGGVAAGRVHEYLDSLGVDYVALRPTWFIENIFEGLSYGIKGSGEVVTVVPNGRIPFISVEDIAQAAYEAITQPTKFKDIFVLGPQALTYDEVVETLKDYVGSPVTHKAISPDEQIARYKAFGLAPDYFQMLVQMEADTNDGREERYLERENKYVGTHTVAGILEARRDFWKQ